MKNAICVFFATIAVFMLGMGENAFAQQAPLFSQYMFNGLYLNPAYAGYKNELYIQGLYRTQWVGVDGAPKFLTVSADGNVAREKVGLGLMFSNDRAGAQQITSFMSNYSYKIMLGDFTTLSFGLGFGAIQYAMEGAKLKPGSMGDPRVATANYNTWVPEGNAGVYLYTDRFYVGLSAMNLVSKYISQESDEHFIERAETQMFVTAGVLLPLSEDFQLKPSVLFREDFKASSSADLNLMLLIYDRIWVGGSYRMGLKLWKDVATVGQFQSDAASLILEVFATKKIRVGYSYDFDFKGFRGHQGGTHEVSLGVYITPRMRRMLSPRYF